MATWICNFPKNNRFGQHCHYEWRKPWWDTVLCNHPLNMGYCTEDFCPYLYAERGREVAELDGLKIGDLVYESDRIVQYEVMYISYHMDLVKIVRLSDKQEYWIESWKLHKVKENE